MNRKADKVWVGITIGLLLPFFIMLIFYMSSYAMVTIPEFLRKMVFASLFFKVLSLCAIVNLGVFFFFYQTKNDKAARGVIWATIIFAFAAAINQILATSI